MNRRSQINTGASLTKLWRFLVARDTFGRYFRLKSLWKWMRCIKVALLVAILLLTFDGSGRQRRKVGDSRPSPCNE
jgi:hypothetical protein